jgi:streptogramin lyase
MLAGVARSISLVESIATAPPGAGGGLAGRTPISGLRVFVSPVDTHKGTGSWAIVDDRSFYADNLSAGDYRLYVHFGNCCGFTQDVSVHDGGLSVVHLDLSRYYSQVFAQSASQATLYELAIAPDGTPWFVEGLGQVTRIGHIGSNGVLSEYELDRNANVSALTPRVDGSAWFLSGNVLRQITPKGRVVALTAEQPERISELAIARDGSAWMADFMGSNVVHYDPSSKKTQTFKLPFVEPGQENVRITASTDGSVWCTSLGGNRIFRFASDGAMTQKDLPWNCGPNTVQDWNNAHIFNCWSGASGAGLIDDATGKASPLDVPGTNDSSVSFSAPLDGRMWFIDRKGGAFVGLDSANKKQTIALKAPLYAFALVGANHRLWFIDTGTHEIVSLGIDGRAVRYPSPSAPRDDTNMPPIDQLVPDRLGNIWFIVRHDMALYKISVVGQVERIAVRARRIEVPR